MWKQILAFAGFGLLFFCAGLGYTFLAPPYDPFAHGNRVAYGVAVAGGFIGLTVIGHRVSLAGRKWIRWAFAATVGIGFFYLLLTSNYPEDPWPSRLLWSTGFIAVFAVLLIAGEWIQNRQRPR